MTHNTRRIALGTFCRGFCTSDADIVAIWMLPIAKAALTRPYIEHVLKLEGTTVRTQYTPDSQEAAGRAINEVVLDGVWAPVSTADELRNTLIGHTTGDSRQQTYLMTWPATHIDNKRGDYQDDDEQTLEQAEAELNLAIKAHGQEVQRDDGHYEDGYPDGDRDVGAPEGHQRAGGSDLSGAIDGEEVPERPCRLRKVMFTKRNQEKSDYLR